ncbi:efflux RND transporter permease subunit [Rubritalea marina]|uniref:efflux RND transporter permease subunit n=1 Tax=Rubritalea marina TaxID=361055 RepID=UPI000365867B|nr:efflux RND transporter permease subunit [Rubritalea marina]
MEGAIRWFSRNHVAANFLMLIIVLAGVMTWFGLKKEVFPETSLDAVTVTVVYPNATAEEVEDGVILPIEDAVADVDGIKRYSASASEGMGQVFVEVETGYDVRDVMSDVKGRVDGISIFPEQIERPVVEELILATQVMSVAVSANTDEKSLKQMAAQVRDGLLRYQEPDADGGSRKLRQMLQGKAEITKASLSNVRPYELSIEVPERALRRYGLELADIANALRAQSVDIPMGSIKERAGDLVLRVQGKLRDVEAVRRVEVVSSRSGEKLTLGQIATVVDGFGDVDLSTRFDGRTAVMVNVYRSGDQDTTLLAYGVRDYIERVAPTELPEGVSLEIWNDQSEMLAGRLSLLGRNGAWGLGLVFVVLALFLRPSLAALVALGIPVSFAGGVWMMPQLGVSVNMISLFAFILVLGIVVDDAIVVGENVYRRIRDGEDPKLASWKGTHEVGVVVTFGVLTTMAAFTPMLGLSGVSGKIWPNIPYVVIPVLFFSLIQSKLVLPAHLAMLKKRRASSEYGLLSKVQHRVADGLEWVIQHGYKPLLEKVLHGRWVVWSCFIAIFIIAIGLVSSGRVPFVFMPKVEGDVVSAQLEMPTGIAFERTSEVVEQIEAAAMQVGAELTGVEGESLIKHALVSSGTQPFQTGFTPLDANVSSHLGEVTLELIPSGEREVSASEFISAWRDALGQIPGVVSLSFKQETNSGGNAIDIEITGSSLNELKAAADHITSELESRPGTTDISTNWRLGKNELVFDGASLTPRGRAMGFTLVEVSRQLRAMFYGEEVQRLQRGRDEVKVMVRYPEAERQSMDVLDEISLRSPSGEKVPLSEVLEGQESRGLSTINRVDGLRAVEISADVDSESGVNANSLVASFNDEVLNGLSEKFPGVQWGYRGEQEDQNTSVKEMGVRFIFALIMIYVLMAIPLKSYLQPVIVMSVIPFGFVGALAGHILLGLDLSIMSLCGLVALAGVVVNDSLVLVEYVNRHRDEHRSVFRAAWHAGASRFRPIILTSLTTFVGLMPMLTETDMQAKFLIPMAVSLGFGILFATLITLLLVPSVYLMLEDLKALSAKLFTGEK